MKVAVIGSSGSMGSMFVRYFASKGYEVVGSDPGSSRKPSVRMARSNAEAASGADLVLVAVPMEMTASVCAELATQMRRGSTLVEISSVKGSLPSELETLSRPRGVSALSVHPLFGPSIPSLKGAKIAVISQGPVRGRLRLARKVFPEAKLIPMPADVHDSLMASVLALTHLLNVSYAKTLAELTTPRLFRQVATPMAGLQLALAEGVLSQDPGLVASIQFSNPHSRRAAAALADSVLGLRDTLIEGDPVKFRSAYKETAGRYRTGPRAVARVYAAANSLGQRRRPSTNGRRR